MFGLFVGHSDTLEKPAMNYAGVALAVLALGMYTQIKTTPAGGDKVTTSISDSALLPPEPLEPGAEERPARLSKPLGVLMAIVAGVLFGNTFTPPDYIRMNGHGPSEPLDYVFSHFCGIFATSTLWFVAYCVLRRGAPLMNPRLTLPAMISGAMWAVAQTSWFIANKALGGASVGFPIITSGPGIISALWGVFVFKEIVGTKNYVRARPPASEPNPSLRL
jgi:hypothetical protein